MVVLPMAHYMVKPAVVMGAKHGDKSGSRVQNNNRSSSVTKKKQQQKAMKKVSGGKTFGKGSYNNNSNLIQNQLSFDSVVKKQQTPASAYIHMKKQQTSAAPYIHMIRKLQC